MLRVLSGRRAGINLGAGHTFSLSRSLVSIRKPEKLGDKNWMASARPNTPLFSQACENNKNPILQVLKQTLDFQSYIRGGDAESPRSMFFLEISSGTGQHIGHLAHELGKECRIICQPSDVGKDAFFSIQHYAKKAWKGMPSQDTVLESCVLEPMIIDVTKHPWVVESGNTEYWEKNPPRCIAPSEDSDMHKTMAQRVTKEFELNKEKVFDVAFNANMAHISPFECSQNIFQGLSKVLRPDGLFFMYGPFNVDGKFTSPSNESFDRQLRQTDPSWGIRDVETIEELGRKNGLQPLKRVQMPANNMTLVFVKV